MKNWIIAIGALGLIACEPAVENEHAMDKEAKTMSDMTAMSDKSDMKQQADDSRIWLEEVEGEKPLAWVREQNARALAKLEADPRFAKLQADALAVVNATDKITYGRHRGGFVYNFWQDADHVRGLWRRAPLGEYVIGNPNWDVLIDFDALSAAEGENWVYKGNSCLPPSYDRCMINLSRGGKDAAVRREFDIASKSFVEGGFEIPEAKGSIAWVDADTLLVGTDWGGDTMTTSGYPFVLKLWERGNDLSSAKEMLRGDKADVGVWPFRVEIDDEAFMFASEASTFYDTTVWYLPEDSAPVKLPIPSKTSFRGVFSGQAIISLEEQWSHNGTNWPKGTVVSFDLKSFMQTGVISKVYQVVLPDARSSVDSISAARSSLIVAMLENVASKVFSYKFDGSSWTATQLDLPENGNIGISSVNAHSDVIFANMESFLRPDSLMMVNVPQNTSKVIQSLPERFDTGNLVVEQLTATSKDGTEVPYFVVRNKDTKMDGTTPTLLYAYGGFQVSMQPTYSGTLGKLWLENSGAYVLANIRGGGEFGPNWHQAGLKMKRQVIYDDFIAVAEDLIANKLTSPKHLGIRGGSNGGLLMGVMYTQRPDLWNAVLSQVPLLDMMRYHKLLAGASWMGEYGNPDDPDEGAFLKSISPYHNVDADTDYPLMFLMTSTKDDRVHPAHARKMGHLLGELDKPFLYYENIDGGHSAAANLKESAKREALGYVFLMQQLMD
ncbi:MAG: S9 family peptidase [Robiginitomaculum sp.]|nr:S9 family peptidase [Robiginitomaculum sp.]